MLQVRDLAVEVGGSVIMDGVSFSIRARDKVGLVGRNGAGKTSLLKVLGGADAPFSGVVQRTGGLGYLPQDPRLDGIDDATTAVRHILAGRGFDEAIVRLEKLRLQMEEDPSDRAVERFTKAEETFNNEGGYAAESEVRRIAAGLGLEAERLDLPISALSGGQRRRVEIARILFAGSDILLLDESTNHLDRDAKEWLLGFMRAYRGALLVISH
ncbi:MAG: ATP-binding cassette domain-containing protein, partial [Acidimicrobiales bacterium]